MRAVRDFEKTGLVLDSSDLKRNIPKLE